MTNATESKRKLLKLKFQVNFFSLLNWVPGAGVFCDVALPVGLVGELQAALVADEGLDAAVRAHVRVEQRLPEVGLPAIGMDSKS